MSNLLKTAEIRTDPVTAEDLEKINKYTLEPLKAEDVFTFKIMAGDNQSDDRNYEPFSSKAILDMAKLYPGKPMIWDHGFGPKGSEAVARIYDAHSQTTGMKLEDGSDELQLVLKAYLPAIDANEALIKEIKAGIKKEVSTRVKPEKLVCSVCGQDQMKSYCRHWAGRDYDGKTCLMQIDGVKDVLEVSFVSMPAQPRAGAVKSYNPDLEDVKPGDFEAKNTSDTKALNPQVLEMELFLMTEMAKGENDD